MSSGNASMPANNNLPLNAPLPLGGALVPANAVPNLPADSRAMIALRKLPVVHLPGSPALTLRPSATLQLNNPKGYKNHNEAALAQERGVLQVTKCVQCTPRMGLGVWTECVTMPGFFTGACANCRYTNEATHCGLASHNGGIITETMMSREGIRKRLIKISVEDAPIYIQEWLDWLPNCSAEPYYQITGAKFCVEAIRRTDPDNPIFQKWAPLPDYGLELLPHQDDKLNAYTEAMAIGIEARRDGLDEVETYKRAAETTRLSSLLFDERHIYQAMLKGSNLYKTLRTSKICLSEDHKAGARVELRVMFDRRFSQVVLASMIEATGLEFPAVPVGPSQSLDPDYLVLPRSRHLPPYKIDGITVKTDRETLLLHNRWLFFGDE